MQRRLRNNATATAASHKAFIINTGAAQLTSLEPVAAWPRKTTATNQRTKQAVRQLGTATMFNADSAPQTCDDTRDTPRVPDASPLVASLISTLPSRVHRRGSSDQHPHIAAHAVVTSKHQRPCRQQLSMCLPSLPLPSSSMQAECPSRCPHRPQSQRRQRRQHHAAVAAVAVIARRSRRQRPAASNNTPTRHHTHAHAP